MPIESSRETCASVAQERHCDQQTSPPNYCRCVADIDMPDWQIWLLAVLEEHQRRLSREIALQLDMGHNFRELGVKSSGCKGVPESQKDFSKSVQFATENTEVLAPCPDILESNDVPTVEACM